MHGVDGSVGDGEWKLTYRPHMPEESELFNLRQDPAELQNRISEQQEIYLALMRDLAERDPWVLEPFPDDGSTILPGAAEALKALGYGGDSDEPGAQSDPTWWWSCPKHPSYRREASLGDHGGQEHDPATCTQPVVPRTDWLALRQKR